MTLLCVMHNTETGFVGLFEKFDYNFVCAWFEVASCYFMAINVSLFVCMRVVIKRLWTMMFGHLLLLILVLQINFVTNAFYNGLK